MPRTPHPLRRTMRIAELVGALPMIVAIPLGVHALGVLSGLAIAPIHLVGATGAYVVLFLVARSVGRRRSAGPGSPEVAPLERRWRAQRSWLALTVIALLLQVPVALRQTRAGVAAGRFELALSLLVVVTSTWLAFAAWRALRRSPA
jgi:hypothetical protein